MNRSETVSVPAQDVPVAGDYDVVVCGGGPAGIPAAVMAARSGARTLLIEQLSSLGGMATNGLVWAWVDTPGGPVFDEMVERLLTIGAGRWHYDPVRYHKPGRIRFHGETLKMLALRMVKDAGADVLFCTTVEGAWMDAGAVRGVFVANKGGRSLVKARVVVDTTADGDVAASAGAESLKGDPEDGRIQHVTFEFDLQGIDAKRAKSEMPPEEAIVETVKAAHREGRLHAPTNVFRPPPDLFPYGLAEHRFFLNNWEIAKVDPTDPFAVSATLAEGQMIALEVVEFCRRHLPGHEKCRVGGLPGLLGTRESRRILGGYIVTGDDVRTARKFDDGVAKATFWIDFHDSPPGRCVPYETEYVHANRPKEGDWYEIPYRCLVPKDVKGLLVAGRCISGDRAAQASFRVMPTCMYTGTAAGAAAAMAVSAGVLPHELDGREVKKRVLG